MLCYEIRKLFQKRLTIVVILLLFLGNGYFAIRREAPGTDYGYDAAALQRAYASLPEDRDFVLPALDAQLERLTEGIWEENYVGPLLTEEAFADRLLFGEVKKRAELVLRYDEYLDSVGQNALVLLHSGLFEDTDSFGYRNIQKSRQVYDNLRGVVPEILYSGSIETLSNGKVTDAALLIVCLLLALEMIYAERKRGTMFLVKPTAKGRNPLLLAKMLSSAALLLTAMLFLYGSNLVIGFIRYGAVSLDAPIQSVYGFEGSGMRITIGTYLLLFLGMKYLWLLGICYLLFFFCLMGRSWPQILLFLCISLCPSLVTFQRTDFLAYFNLVGAGNTEELFRIYRNLNLFGFPASTMTVSILFLCLLLLFAVFGSFIAHRYCTPMLSPGRTKGERKKLRISLSIFGHESYKFWISGGALFVLSLLACLQVSQAIAFDERLSAADKIYTNYCTILQGEPNSEKDAYLASEEERFLQLYRKLENYGEMAAAGEIDQNAYQILCNGVSRELETEHIFLRVVDQYNQAKQKGCHLVCTLAYDRLSGTKGRGELLFRSVLLMIALILGISGMEATERETQMDLLIHTTTGEQKSGHRKGMILSVYTLLCTFFTYLPYLIALNKVYGFSGLWSPSESVAVLKIGFGSVASSLMIYGMITVFLSLAAANWIRFLSRKSGNTITAMLISSATLLLPAVALWLIQMI